MIERIAGVVRPAGLEQGVVLGIGDDTAALDTGGEQLLLATVDMQVEGRHFIRSRTPPELLGRRVAAVNLSDIAAMGGTPRWALVSLALPKRLAAGWVEAFYRGLDAALARFGAVVVGGNLSGGSRIVCDLTLLGEVDRGRLMRRDGARVGDAVLVTGTLGRSAAGRAALDAGLREPWTEDAIAAHLAPEPKVTEGMAIAGFGTATAMMDLSDGLASDLGHICDRSGVGAVIEAAALPVDEATRRIAAELGLDVTALALGGGEDFELLLTAPPAAVPELQRALDRCGSPLTAVGEVRPAAEGRTLRLADGRLLPLTASGWDHFRSR